MTEVYSPDATQNCILRYDIDSALNRRDTALGIAYGVPWLAVDLDGDGTIELVVQRGDPGFGGDGYLDILSAPDWHLRQRFVFPGMKVYMYPVAVNLDGDPEQELFLTPQSLGGDARGVIIDYDRNTGSFVKTVDIPAPTGTSGPAAVGDFDGDGRVEFIRGNWLGYGLFESDGVGLSYIGQVGDSSDWNNSCAVAVRPKPGGVLHALLGHSTGNGVGFWYQLLEPAGNNSFHTSHTFLEYTGWVGNDPCFAADVDCDGLDEMIMDFYPTMREWEWDASLGDFIRGCSWDENALGTFVQIQSVDVNQDGVAEWGVINHQNVFRALQDSCIGCDSTGRCLPASPICYCACHGDPQCDGITDVVDVINTIDVAFRGMPPQADPATHCPWVRTDADCSGVTNVLDVVKVINIAFRGANKATAFCNPCP